MIKAKYIKSDMRVISVGDSGVVRGGYFCRCEATYINSSNADVVEDVKEYKTTEEFRASGAYRGTIVNIFETSNAFACKHSCDERGMKMRSCVGNNA